MTNSPHSLHYFNYQAALAAYRNTVHNLNVRGGRVRWPGKAAPRALRGRVRRAHRKARALARLVEQFN